MDDDSLQIQKLIPQRAPFLFVDKILEWDGEKIKTAWHLTGKEDFFAGHFPGRPLCPGVLLQEAIFQTGAILMGKMNEALPPTENDQIGVVSKVSNAKFKNMAKPGDTVVMKVELVDQIGNAYYFKGRSSVEERLVLVIEFTCAMVPTETIDN